MYKLRKNHEEFEKSVRMEGREPNEQEKRQSKCGIC